ncbi:MAG: YcxB family protein [Lachnospiraceae bacterium]|nr:YcxB family protein [Lachnospiraceae bacterium]
MSPKQAENEVKEKSIAEKARMTVSDVQDEVVETSNAEEVSGDAVNEAVEEDTTKENSDPLAEIYGDTEIRLDFKVDKWDMYAFLMHHSYMSLSGIIGILLSLFCIGRAISEFVSGTTSPTTAIFVVVGLWFLVISPITMLGKAAMQIKTNSFLQKPITYIFTENGLIQEQGEMKAGCRWEQVTKVVMMKRVWILYTGKVRGSIMPVRQFGEQGEELKALIAEHTGKKH